MGAEGLTSQTHQISKDWRQSDSRTQTPLSVFNGLFPPGKVKKFRQRRNGRFPVPDSTRLSPSCPDQEGRKGSEEGVPENLGVPLEGDRDFGELCGLHQGCQVPFRAFNRIRLQERRKRKEVGADTGEGHSCHPWTPWGTPAAPRPSPGRDPAPQGRPRRALIYGPLRRAGTRRAFLSGCQEELSWLCRKPRTVPAFWGRLHHWA